MKFFVPHAEDAAQVMAGRIRCSGSAALSDSKARPWSDEAREAERLKPLSGASLESLRASYSRLHDRRAGRG
jgi:hypothetical protein